MKRKKFFFGFAKTSENEAKQDAFRFEAKIKKERKRDTLIEHSWRPLFNSSQKGGEEGKHLYCCQPLHSKIQNCGDSEDPGK
jgi:hypothetical protein